MKLAMHFCLLMQSCVHMLVVELSLLVGCSLGRYLYLYLSVYILFVFCL